MFNFQRWKANRFIRGLCGWSRKEAGRAHREEAEKREEQAALFIEDGAAGVSASVNASPPAVRKKRKEKKIKGAPFKREPWANGKKTLSEPPSLLPRATNGTATAASVSAPSIESLEDSLESFRIEPYIPKEFDAECFKAVIVYPFLRPGHKNKMVGGNYIPEATVVQRLLHKGYKGEEIKKALRWLVGHNVVHSPRRGEAGVTLLSLNLKHQLAKGPQAQAICRAVAAKINEIRGDK